MAVEGIAHELGVSSSATPFLIETDQSLSRHGAFAPFVRDADEGEIDHVKADDIEFAVAGREASEALEPVEEALDQVSGPVGARSTRSTITRADAPSDTLWRVGTPAAPQAPARYATAGWRFRFLLALVGLLIALVSGLLTKDIASADDRETVLTHLRPGDNYVGWISDSQPVQMLFAQLSQIEVIWAWNASRQQFMLAAPTVPSQLWTLHTLEPGMGLILRFGGESPVKWTRERSNAEAVVKLASGYNLVAWMEEDQTSLRQALGGIGRPLRGAGIWSTDAETMVYRTGDELQRSGQSPPVALGAALWVNVDRSTYWLQSHLAPTHIHWFTHPEVNTDRNKQGSATIQYGAGSFYQLISRLSIEGCEVINLQIDDLEYDFRHTNTQNSAFEGRYDSHISPGSRVMVQCVDHCDMVYAGSNASDSLVRYAEQQEDLRCRPFEIRPELITESSDCKTDWPELFARLFQYIPLFQDLCWIESDASAKGFREVGRLGAVHGNVGFLGEAVVLSHFRAEIHLIDRNEIDLNTPWWSFTMIHEFCHVHQNWYVLKQQIDHAYLNGAPHLVEGRSRNSSDIWFDTEMAHEFIALTGFVQKPGGSWKLSGNSVKARTSHVAESPIELSADVCALYMTKRLAPDHLRGYDRFTRPPYLTEELERWVEQYVVLPE